MHSRTHVHTHIHTHARTHACTHSRTHARTHARTHTHTHTHTHARRGAYVYAYTHILKRTRASAHAHYNTGRSLVISAQLGVTGDLHTIVSTWSSKINVYLKDSKERLFTMTQTHNLRGNLLRQATKRHLNNSWTVKNDEKLDDLSSVGWVVAQCLEERWHGIFVFMCLDPVLEG